MSIFARTGEIAERIHRGSYVDILVKAPASGSFIETILIPGLQEAAATAISTQFTALFSYVWQLLAPRLPEVDDTVVELARIRLAEDQERTKQSQEETRRIRELQKIVREQSATTQQALSLLEWSLKTDNTAVGRLAAAGVDFSGTEADLLSEKAREENLKADVDYLERLDEKKIARLTSRVRPMIREIALPLRRSASSLSIGTEKNDRAFATLDQSRVRQIEQRSIREEPVTFQGHLKSYDRDSGTGRITSPVYDRQIAFFVPPGTRRRLREAILAAMRVETATFIATEVVDGSDVVTSLILHQVTIST